MGGPCPGSDFPGTPCGSVDGGRQPRARPSQSFHIPTIVLTRWTEDDVTLLSGCDDDHSGAGMAAMYRVAFFGGKSVAKASLYP